MKRDEPSINNPLSRWLVKSEVNQAAIARAAGMQPPQLRVLARTDNPNPTLMTMLRIEEATLRAVRLEDWRR